MAYKKLAYLLLIALLIALLLCITSCSVAESANIPLGEQELPDMILDNAQYTLGRPNEGALIMAAIKMTVYKDKETQLEQVTFKQVGENGIEGSCDIALLDENGEKATLIGNVTLNRQSDDLTINAQSIEWDNETMSLKTTGIVSVIYGNGTQVEAEGFSAILDEDNFEFGRIIKGVVQ